MKSGLVCASVLGLLSASGCVSRHEHVPVRRSDSEVLGAPQVKQVLSPHFHSAAISRIAIVSTRFKEEAVSSQPNPATLDRQQLGYVEGYTPYGRGQNRIEPDAQSGRNATLTDRDSLASVIEDVFIRSLIGKGYSYASRKEVREIVLEQSFQHSGLTDSDAVKMGKLLNVPAVLLITVSHLGAVDAFQGSLLTLPFQLAGALLMPPSGSSCTIQCSMTARLISTQTGEVLWLASVNDFCLKQRTNDPRPVLQQSTELIAESFPSQHAER